MARAIVGLQMRWFACAIMVLMLNAACSVQVRAAQAEVARQKALVSSASDGQAKPTSRDSAHADPSREPGNEEESWFSDCLRDQGGSQLSDAGCYSRYQEQLESTQANLLQEIRAALSKPGPSGTDYVAAAKLLDVSQRDWKSYADADCEIVSKVFGDGSAEGLASGDCIIARYEDRNEKLKGLKQSYLDN